ncbi:MAG TPA: class I SAM-dependent methyltransferase [Gaiellaceae bacterium]|nr:class I SAM-dependent methyltransferase [Gaiellaceae bacterium]
MRALLESAGKRFARLATRAVVARPGLWRLFRRPLRAQFDRLAPVWHGRLGPEALAALSAALDRLERPPRRVLDVGTGTGKAAALVAERFPEAEVVGVDLAPGMVAEARRVVPAGTAERVRFEVADAAALPFEDAAFDLVVLLNMIPFFAEIARVTAPAGTVVASFASGPSTPIWTPAETLRSRLAPLGFGGFEELSAGPATALLARRSNPG